MRTDPSHKHGTPGLIRQIGSVPLQAFWATQSKPFSPSTGTQSIPAARRVAARSELHKSVPLSRFMKLRGCLRADQPISGRFSRHYYSIGVPPLQLQNSDSPLNFPGEAFTFPLSCGIIVSRSPGEGVPPGVSSWNFKRNSISFLLLSDMIFLS